MIEKQESAERHPSKLLGGFIDISTFLLLSLIFGVAIYFLGHLAYDLLVTR